MPGQESINDQREVKQKRTYVFLSGMPRSMSTILSSILAQNNRIHTTATSPVIEVIMKMREAWYGSPTPRANPHDDNDELPIRMMRAAFDAAYATDKPVIIDKSRAWCYHPEVAEMLSVDKERTANKRVRFIVCVRDLREILASLERKYRVSIDTRIPSGKLNTIERLEENLKQEGLVGGPLMAVKECALRGYRDDMLIVEATKLSKEPKKVLREICDFIGEKEFDHDYENVVNVTPEDDLIWGYKGLHKINSKVEEVKDAWQQTFTGHILEHPLWTQIMKEYEYWDVKSIGKGPVA